MPKWHSTIINSTAWKQKCLKSCPYFWQLLHESQLTNRLSKWQPYRQFQAHNILAVNSRILQTNYYNKHHTEQQQQHSFNSPLSRTTGVSRYHTGKTNLDFIETGDSDWQWHQLVHMQICTSPQTDNHSSTTPQVFYRPDTLPATQPTASKHWRQSIT